MIANRVAIRWSSAANMPIRSCRFAEIPGFPPVVVEDPPGRWRLHPDISSFGARVFEGERSKRRWRRSQQALVAALEELSEEHFRVIADPDGLRRLDPAGDSINEQAQHAGLTNRESPVPVLLRRDEHGLWKMHPFTRVRLKDLWRPPQQ